MHYSWSTEARARRALANVSALLRPGGTFIGTMPDANVIIKKLREGFFLVPCHLVVLVHTKVKNWKIWALSQQYGLRLLLHFCWLYMLKLIETKEFIGVSLLRKFSFTLMFQSWSFITDVSTKMVSVFWLGHLKKLNGLLRIVDF